MIKKLFGLLLAFLTVVQTVNAQMVSAYFDRKFRKVQNYADARYRVYQVDTVNGGIGVVMYGNELNRIYARGKVYPADTLTFEGKVIFEGRDDSTAVRYYKNGRLLPLLLTDAKLQIMPREQATCYVAIGEDGEFYAYRFANLAVSLPVANIREDALLIQGRFSNVATMQLDGTVKYYENGKLTGCKKFKNGVLIPFIESTTDIQEPYERMEVVNFMAYRHDIKDLDIEYKKFVLQCAATGADGVIGIKTSFTARSWDTGVYGYDILIQGTTISLKNRQ
jgi:hypothetical protein